MADARLFAHASRLDPLNDHHCPILTLDTAPTPRVYSFDDTSEISAGGRERVLLILAALFVGVTFAALVMVHGDSPMAAWPFGVWLICTAGGHRALEQRLPRRDPFIFPIVMLLSGWGLALVARLAPAFAVRQTVWLIVSTIALIGVTLMPRHLRWLSRYRYLWLVGGLGLLAATILFGRNPAGYGPRLWLGVTDAYFQPSELLKVILVTFLASYLADNRDLLNSQGITLGRLRLPSPRYLAPLLIMWSITAVILIWQRDLGMPTLYFIVFLAMLYVATGRSLYVIGGAILLLAAGSVAYFAFDVVRLRVDIWFNPWPEADNRAFQIVQSLLAFASGSVFGQGIGQGSPTYIPVVHSDFVFAAIGEEWGLLGTLAVIACMGVLVVRALRLGASQARAFRALLAAGIGITLATQSLLIMGGTIKLIPLTGITLPFLSYGGSSLLVNFVMIGLLLTLSDPR